MLKITVTNLAQINLEFFVILRVHRIYCLVPSAYFEK